MSNIINSSSKLFLSVYSSHPEINNICSEIRRTTEFVVKNSKHVFIDFSSINSEIQLNKDKFYTFDTLQRIISDWHLTHFTPKTHCNFDPQSNSMNELLVQYVFVLDTLNYCFWPSTQHFQYNDLASRLKELLHNDSHIFDSESLIQLDEQTFTSKWFPNIDIPLVSERVRMLQELGIMLKSYFNGRAVDVVKASNNSGECLINIISSYLPSWRDTALYEGRLIFFYKRAQILVGDLIAAFHSTKIVDDKYFFDASKLTCFADYRLPQLFNHLGILHYSSELQSMIDNGIIIPSGSEFEVEIRASTIQVVEYLYDFLKKTNSVTLERYELDWLLWNRGEELEKNENLFKKQNINKAFSLHHKTLSIYY